MSNLLIRLKCCRKLLNPRPSKRIGQCKCPHRRKHWLQRNRIDGRDACLSVGVMNQLIRFKQETPLAIHCQFCGGLMRT